MHVLAIEQCSHTVEREAQQLLSGQRGVLLILQVGCERSSKQD